MGKPRGYTNEEIDFLKSFIPNHSHIEILNEFNSIFEKPLNNNHLKSFITKYGITTRRDCRFHVGKDANESCVFKKGEYPKGSEKSWFKKGHLPGNHKPIGSIVVRKNVRNGNCQVYIKTAEPNTWECYNRVLWEEHYGKIPKGYVVAYRDGDTTNCTIENLRLVRREDMANVSHYKNVDNKYRDTIISISELRGSIRRKINAEHIDGLE